MNILVHSIFYRPEPLGVGAYTARMCEWLAARGHSVRVVSPPPYYPHWKIQPPYAPWTWRRETLDGVAVTRCPIWLPEKPSGLGRILHALSFLASSFPAMLAEAARRPDVVIVIEPSLLNAVAGLAAARLTGAAALLHVQDFEIDLAFGLRQFRAGALRRAIAGLESWLMRRFDAVSTISAAMLRRLAEKGVTQSQAVLFPNWADTDAIFPLERPASEKIRALYSGSGGPKQGLGVLIEAARALQSRPDIEIVICSERIDALRGRARGLANVRFLPLAPADALNRLLNGADIHLLPQSPAADGLVMPSKLLGMLASGRPVVATARPESEIARVVSRCGVVTPPEDASALAAAIAALADSPDLRARLGRQARAIAVAECGRDAILEAFERELLSRCGARNPAEARLATR